MLQQLMKEKKAYNCKICNANFALKNTLKVHVQVVHEGKKPHKCNCCGKCFSQSHLIRHTAVVHEGKKSFRCIKCEATFGFKSNLTVHLAKVHNGVKRVPVECTKCNKSFVDKFGLKMHLDTIHERKSHNCTICGLSLIHISEPTRPY